MPVPVPRPPGASAADGRTLKPLDFLLLLAAVALLTIRVAFGAPAFLPLSSMAAWPAESPSEEVEPEEPSGPPRLTWAPIYSTLLDGVDRGGAPVPVSSAFYETVGVLDLVLAGDCVVAFVPVYTWLAPAFVLANLTVEVAGVPDLIASVPFLAHDGNNVWSASWCSAALRTTASADVTLRYGAKFARTTVARPVVPARRRGRAPAGPAGFLAVCTLFARPYSFAPWAEYMLGIGVDVVFAYYNAPAVPTNDTVAADPALRAMARLVAQGRLVLHAWPMAYSFYTTAGVGVGLSQAASMYSCMTRYRSHFEWMAYLDDDEYPYVLGNRTLRGLLRDKAGQPALQLGGRWTAAPSMPRNASLATILALPMRAAPEPWPLRTKQINHVSALPTWEIHYHKTACPRYSCTDAAARAANACCVRGDEGGFLHFTDLWGAHLTADSKTWGDASTWAVTTVLADTLRKGVAERARPGAARQRPRGG